MSEPNWSVYCGVGYAHAKEKMIVLLTGEADAIPFDLAQRRHVVHRGQFSDLQEQLRRELEWVLEEVAGKERTNLSASAKISANLESTKWSATAVLDFTFIISNETDRRSPEISDIYFHSGPGWSFRQRGKELSCLDSDRSPYRKQVFLPPPASRLEPGTRVEVRLQARKVLGLAFDGDELQDEYPVRGQALLRVVTREEEFLQTIAVTVTADEIPF